MNFQETTNRHSRSFNNDPIKFSLARNLIEMFLFLSLSFLLFGLYARDAGAAESFIKRRQLGRMGKNAS